MPYFRSALLALIVTYAFSAQAQTKLNFPRLLGLTELPTTGLALVNTGSSSATATFNCYGADGTLSAQSVQNVPAKGQVARLASEVLPAAKAACWVQVQASTTEVQGFELVGDFAQVVDTAGPAAESNQLAVVAFSSSDVVYIVNPSSQIGTVQVTLNSPTGASLGSRSIQLNGLQATSVQLGDISQDSSVHLVSITSNVAMSATLTTILPGGIDIAMTNATPVSGAPNTLFFPFSPNGPQGASNWKTVLGIANLASTAQNVSLTFTPESGAPVTIQRNLSAGGSVGDTVANLFSLSPTSFTAGWIRATGTGGLSGAAAYQDAATGALAVVPSQSSGSTAFFFGHIASLSPWYTGIALLNTGTAAANVEVYAIDPTGQLLGSPASFALGAGRRTALLSEFVPALTQRASDGGWVFVRTTNSVPLLGFEVFGHAVSPILANVQGFTLPQSSTFTPPTLTAISGVSIDRVTTTDGSVAKNGFRPGDLITYVTTISVAAGTTGSAPLTITVKDPRSQTLLTNTVTAALTSGDRTLLSLIPGNALNGDYTVTVSMVYQGVTIARSAVYQVSNGSATPTVGQETPVSVTLSNNLQFAFRPGDTVRFLITSANFTNQTATGTLNYSLTGPGALAAGSGSANVSVAPGLSPVTTVDLAIPAGAVQGIFAFSSTLTAGGTTTTKRATITVAPKSATEAIEIDGVYVSDGNGVPRGGVAPGSNIILNNWRRSLFAITTPATVRYTVTGPGGSVLDQPIAVNVLNGGSIGSTLFGISPTAVPGTYTYQSQISYQDNSNTTKTATLSTDFVIGNNPPSLTPAVTSWKPYIQDINFVTRTSFSPGEVLVLTRVVYSTYTTPVTGTVRYQVTGLGNTILLDQTLNTTFNPGVNSSFIGVTTSNTLPAANYTFNLTATATGAATGSTNSTVFAIAGGSAP